MFKLVNYEELKARQQENYNFQKFAARLADYGYNCLRLTDDWQGADFIACHIDGETFLKVQLKGRLTVDLKYKCKNIYIAFIYEEYFYIYPHDEIMNKSLVRISGTKSWINSKLYSWPSPPEWAKKLLTDFKI